MLEVGDDLGDAEQAHRDDDEADAVGKLGMPKVKRGTPELTSVPTSPSSRPSTIMPIALSSEPCASTTAATRPSTISEKYSAGPNCSATLGERRREQRDQQRARREPAKNEPSAAIASAGPARPLRAIW